MKEKQENSNVEKIKEIISGFAPAGMIGGGIATGSPELTATGAMSFFGNILSPIIRGRRDKFLELLQESIIKLQKDFEEFQPENLAKNERFATAVIKTTEIALRTHQNEKRELLKNAALNSVIKDSIHEDEEYVLLSIIDILLPIHVKALQEFLDLTGTKEDKIAIEVIEKKFHGYLSDLVSQGLLILHEDVGAILLESAPELPKYTITDKGRKFLEFIKID